MMECAEAQQIISAAFDSEQSDARALGLAKDHCRECDECAVFVTTLTAMNRLPSPGMPELALERMLAALRAEYPVESAEPVDSPAPLAADLPVESREIREVVRPRVPGWAPWAAAAAVLLVAAGVITSQGVRYLLQPSSAADSSAEITATDSNGDRQQEMGAESGLAAEQPATQDEAVTASESPSYVVFGQDVYRLSSATIGEPTGSQIGSVTTALDTGGAATAYPVFADPSSETIIVDVGDDALMRFDPVVRTVRGTAYALRSGAIPAFGQWPSLPSGIPEPSAPDGSPVFIAAGADDAGVTLYVQPGTDPAEGFAIAPGTAPSDPAGGNTGWTWWEPRR